jgi:hypothetical protein
VGRIRQKSRQIELKVTAISLRQNAALFEEIRQLKLSREVRARARLPCHHVPFDANPHFSGRQSDLENMYLHLSGGKDSLRAVAVYGLGGMGKSQTCLEYYIRHSEDYQAAFWISADTIEKLALDVREALVQLGILSEYGEENHEQCRRIFNDWLRDSGI